MPSGTIGVVAELWRYPVKSLCGLNVSTLDLDGRGATGDRAFAVYGVDGKIGSGKSTRRFRRLDGLLEVRTAIDPAGSLVVRMPDGLAVPVPSIAADEALSAHLGERVEMRGEMEVAHLDAGPLHLLTTSSLEWLGTRLGGAVSSVRFRPNLVIRTHEAGPEVEAGWAGRRLRVGDAIVEVTEPTERCVMVNAPQPGAPTDERILRVLAQERSACFGVYASVVRPGRIAVDALVELLGHDS